MNVSVEHMHCEHGTHGGEDGGGDVEDDAHDRVQVEQDEHDREEVGEEAEVGGASVFEPLPTKVDVRTR